MEAEHPLYAPVHGVVGEQLENHKRKTDNFSKLGLGVFACFHYFLCVDCVWCRPFRTTPTRSARLDRARYSYLSHATREASAAASSTSACLLSCSGLLC